MLKNPNNNNSKSEIINPKGPVGYNDSLKKEQQKNRCTILPAASRYGHPGVPVGSLMQKTKHY
jgi:hypothetical protein